MLCNPTFPVEWAGFEVSYNGYFTEVNWTTALELNNDYFIVERSTNGQDFAALGQINAKGSNSSYYFEDRTVNNTGVNRLYYRIRQYDVNGDNSTSDMVELLINQKPGSVKIIGVYPNPADEYVTLQLDAMNLDSLSLTLTESSGREIKNVFRTRNQREVILDTRDLANGYYVIRVYDGNSTAMGKFQIVR